MPETIESFLLAVHRTFTEVTRRAPDYFATRPLRASTPPEGTAEAVAAAFAVTLSVTGPEEFTATDDLLDRRRRARPAGITGAVPADGWSRWRRRQDRRVALRAARAAHLARAMDRRTARHAGRDLRYRVGGRGPVLVLLTALGYTDEIWYPLAERMLPGRRVVMWDAGERDPSGRPWTLAGHLADIDAVLDAEGAHSCDLIGWCSGAQVLLEYAHSRPATVRAAVLLHGSYPRARTDVCSEYERNLAAVCASVVAQPRRASRVLRMLTGETAAAPLPADEHRAAVETLARPPSDMAAVLRHPFRDADALVRYSHQLAELWQRPLPPPIPDMPPLLSLAAELDRIAAPEPPAALTPLLAGGHGLLVGATHYSMLDRPDVVVAACTAFLDDPAGGVPADGPEEIRWSAPATTDRPQPSLSQPTME